MQTFLIAILFLSAAFYLLRMIYQEYKGKGGHCSSCEVEHTVNIKKADQ